MRVNEVTAGPLFPDDGPLGKRVFRRVRGIGLEILAFVLVTVLFPVLIVGAAIVDLVLWVRRRKTWMGTRLVAMGWWFLAGEMYALGALLFIWLATGGPFGKGSLQRSRMLYGLRIHWTSWILGGIRRIFGLRFELDGLEQ